MLKDLCFEILDKCPNNCRFCSSNSNYTGTQIVSFEDFKRVIDYFMSQGGIGELSLSGGEPFLHPELIQMVAYAKSLGIRTVIFTSGIKERAPLSVELIAYYTKEMNDILRQIEVHEPFNEFLKGKVRAHYTRLMNPPRFCGLNKDELMMMKQLGLDKIVFDYQAYDEHTDCYLMGRDANSHQYLLDSLATAIACNLNIDIHFVPMKVNYKQVGDILEMLEIGKVEQISFLKFVPQGRGRLNKDELQLCDTELEEFMAIVDRTRPYYSGNIRIGIPLQNANTHKCTAGLQKLNIKYDGTILPCPAFKELDMETMKRFGMKHYSIYENLEEVVVPGGTRVEPLCRKIYLHKD